MLDLGFDEVETDLSRCLGRIIHEVFEIREQGIGQAMHADETRLGKLHEVRPGSSLAIAARAKAWQIAMMGNGANHVVQRARIRDRKLARGIMFAGIPPVCQNSTRS